MSVKVNFVGPIAGRDGLHLAQATIQKASLAFDRSLRYLMLYYRNYAQIKSEKHARGCENMPSSREGPHTAGRSSQLCAACSYPVERIWALRAVLIPLKLRRT